MKKEQHVEAEISEWSSAKKDRSLLRNLVAKFLVGKNFSITFTAESSREWKP